LPLSEKVRIEIFIPDLPDPTYDLILDEFAVELTYTFGGCTVTRSSGKYRSESGVILPNKISILFADTPFEWEKDRVILTQYAEELHSVIQRALNAEETILIAIHRIYHVDWNLERFAGRLRSRF
jgi:hypothetical protein